ncbi:MAG: hypothetical protein Tsb0013_19870 [Phycisphaerales bacterium]
MIRRRLAPVFTASMPVVSLALSGVVLGGCSGGVWGDYGHEASRVVAMDVAASPVFRLEGEVGDVRVSASPDADRISALVELVGKGHSPEAARDRLEEMNGTLHANATPGVVLASVTHPPVRGNTPYAAHWSVTVPEGTRVEIVSDVGDVSVIDTRGPVDIRTDVGDVWVSGVTDASVRGDVGDLSVCATGVVSVRADVGDVTACLLHTGEASQSVATDVGDVYVVVVPSWSGELTARTDVGDVLVLDGARGRVTGEDRLSVRLGADGSATLLARTAVGDVTVVTDGDTAPMGAPPELTVPSATEEPAPLERSEATSADRP